MAPTATSAPPIVPQVPAATSVVAEKALHAAATMLNNLLAATSGESRTSVTSPTSTQSTLFSSSPSPLTTSPLVSTSTVTDFPPPPPVPDQHAGVFIYGFCLVLIPTATILGNLLVIVSVLRFKALHSAINFLILGLAVADLLVAIFVMPYAVYVYVQGGYWFLGSLMCDIYLASDVVCSTASILLLAVISFDRYRAVSRPIQYSRQSQNIRRVVFILIGIWLISLALASPMVLGVNHRPADASPYECRFYNPEFSIGSSIVSFVVPCFLVLFVYIRIMMALRRREKAAKMRRLANQQESNKVGDIAEKHDAGEIVAAPDEHDVGGSSSPLSSSDSLSENLHVVTNDFVSEAPTSMSRKSSERDSSGLANHSSPANARADKNRSSVNTKEKTLKQQDSVIRNSMRRFKSFHANHRTIQLPNMADMSKAKAEILRHLSKRSPRLFRPSASPSSTNSAPSAILNSTHRAAVHKKFSYSGLESARASISSGPYGSARRKSESYATATSLRPRGFRSSISSKPMNGPHKMGMPSPIQEISIPLMSQMASNNNNNNDEPVPQRKTSKRYPGALTSSALSEELDYADVNSMHDSQQFSRITDSETANRQRSPVPYSEETTSSATDVNLISPIQSIAIPLVSPIHDSNDSYTQISPDYTFYDAKKPAPGTLVIENQSATDEKSTPKQNGKNGVREEANSPSVSFKIPGKEQKPFRRLSSAMDVLESNKQPLLEKPPIPNSHSSNAVTASPKHSKAHARSFSQKLSTASSNFGGAKGAEHSVESCYSSSQSQNTNTTGGAQTGTPTPTKNIESKLRMVKRAINRKESSLKRKVNKSQRKEKRATKTLGIVVGIFLVCWVPFFVINILNAVCVKIEEPSCEVGFSPFFYATWLGYTNSFINPIIYTIFNTEFRRAFKSLILGRSSGRRQRARHV